MGHISKVTLVYLTPVQKKKHHNTFYAKNKTLSIVSKKKAHVHAHTQNVIPKILINPDQSTESTG
jgi:hypothetical protein